MVFAHFRLCRGFAGGAGHAGALAGKSAPDAGQLDRPFGGLECRFELSQAVGEMAALEIYTTRPDTLYGASFCAISPDHPLAVQLAENDAALAAFRTECAQRGTSEADIEAGEKLGFDTGLTARHPLDPEWHLPVYVANFVLMGYGTGAIFACPAHDQRDLDFALKYQLPVTTVVRPKDEAGFSVTDSAYTGDGVMVNSGALDGLTPQAAREKIIAQFEAQGAVKDASISASAIGAFRGNAIGAARYRLFYATHAAVCRCRAQICR